MKTQTQLQTMRALDLFGSLQPEQEQELDRKLEVKSNPSLEYLVKDYEEFMEKSDNYYDWAERLYDKLRFYEITSKNIEEFSLYLSNYQKLKNFYLSGYFLSRAINDSNDKEFTIHTKPLDSLIDNIGYKNNGKTIIINGNAGNWLGESMIEGSITVNGNAGNWVGSLMKNGNITVKGNAGNYIGYEMKRGIINLKGEYKSLSFIIKGGNIYHKGKLIVKNGEKIK